MYQFGKRTFSLLPESEKLLQNSKHVESDITKLLLQCSGCNNDLWYSPLLTTIILTELLAKNLITCTRTELMIQKIQYSPLYFPQLRYTGGQNLRLLIRHSVRKNMFFTDSEACFLRCIQENMGEPPKKKTSR